MLTIDNRTKLKGKSVNNTFYIPRHLFIEFFFFQTFIVKELFLGPTPQYLPFSCTVCITMSSVEEFIAFDEGRQCCFSN